MASPKPEGLFIGVDVGTGSARAALVTDAGRVLSTSSEPIKTWNPLTDHYEQSSDDIWRACVSVIKDVVRGRSPAHVKGIGFDATCSLVALSKDNAPSSVSTTRNNEQNVILWMDHRAKSETDAINATAHRVLDYVGGKVSLEMQMPKLLWLKRHSPSWSGVGRFFDLPDYLTWRATGCDSRSLCSVVCKWNYEIDPAGQAAAGWNEEFLRRIDLADLLEDDCEKIGARVVAPGSPCGAGLCEAAALELGLCEGTAVGASIIDAHAGGLGTLGLLHDGAPSRLALVCGTSTCHMAVSREPKFVAGVWGPYYGAMIPNWWLSEAGQSASGALIEHVIDSHPATKDIREKLGGKISIHEYLQNVIEALTKKYNYANHCFLTKDFHMWPDYHGNRSPIADPTLTGMICGLKLSSDKENLAIMYLATLQSLSYGTRHIMDRLTSAGHDRFESLTICGGLAKNRLYVQVQADAAGVPLLCPAEPESVLLGAAILGACASGHYADVETASSKMAGGAAVVRPNADVADYHDRKYRVFLKMLADQRSYAEIMAG